MLSSAAFAADMPIAPPPMTYAPPPVEDFGGWYLRGDIGMTNQRVDSLALTTSPPAGFQSRPEWDLTARCLTISASATGSTTGSVPT